LFVFNALGKERDRVVVNITIEEKKLIQKPLVIEKGPQI
jgi:hypothetical protein